MTWALLLCAVVPDAPRTFMLVPETGVLAATAELPQSLTDARKLVEQLRYEEAMVEYQRYLGLPERPVKERALAMLELGFIHLLLDDALNAEARALAALELDADLPAPASAPRKQREFLEAMKKKFRARPRLEVLPRVGDDAPNLVRVKVTDPRSVVKRLLLRHALAANGPFHSVEMSCEGGDCHASIPPPKGSSGFTAYYFVEAVDEAQATQARAASDVAPLQLAVVEQKAWFQSPVVWGVVGLVLVGGASVAYALSPQPPH
jgi:hypothetical protein